MTDQLFGRTYRLQVDTVVIEQTETNESLDITFSVTKSLTKDPNTLECTIFNLNAEHREKLQQLKNPVVQLEVGYRDRSGVIFLGDVRDVGSIYNAQNATWETVISSGDGEKATQFDRIQKSYRAGASLPTVLKDIAKSMDGVGLGNLPAQSFAGALPGGQTSFVHGVTVTGNSAKAMEKLIKSAGLEWSIQDGKIQVLEAGKTLGTTAVVLGANSGLVAPLPTVDNEGVVRFTSLMNSDIIPGRQVIINSKQLSGRFRVEKCEYTGDSTAQPWYVIGECKEIKV